MTHPTLLHETVEGEALTVDGEAYRHLFRARRLGPGARLRVVDGRGGARWGEVERVDRGSARVRLGEPAPANDPALRLHLFVPTCRPERASWLVEKATEVGVAGIHFLNTLRAPRELGEGTLERLRRVASAALEQCHGATLPAVTGPHPWRDLGGLANPFEARWFLDTGGGTGGWGAFPETSGALLVGPEGGLEAVERRELLAAGWRPVGLGERILRLETAAVVGAAAVLLGRN